MYTTENETPSQCNIINKNTSGNTLFFQPKLTIDAPGDQYEQEADAMADKVMRMPANEQSFFSPKPLPISKLQRKCKECEEEKQMQGKEEKNNKNDADTQTESYISSLNGKGKLLTQEERSFFEPRFGCDFSNVQLHTNTNANESAKNVNALAYTYNNIVFGSNQYQSNTANGKRLLAHELAHVVQKTNYNHIQREITESTDPEREYSTHADALSKHIHNSERTAVKCKTVKTQRWGCDTACSRAGFIDNDNSSRARQGEESESNCCNKWPPFVESFARNQLSLNGVGSCKGNMYKTIQKVKYKENEIRIGCTDSTTSNADHEIELSPLAAVDLFGSVEFNKNQNVKTCNDGTLSNLCVKDTKDLNNTHNGPFPDQIGCLEKGCKLKDDSATCNDYGWPRV